MNGLSLWASVFALVEVVGTFFVFLFLVSPNWLQLFLFCPFQLASSDKFFFAASIFSLSTVFFCWHIFGLSRNKK